MCAALPDILPEHFCIISQNLERSGNKKELNQCLVLKIGLSPILSDAHCWPLESEYVSCVSHFIVLSYMLVI